MKETEDPVELVAAAAREQDLMADPRWEALADGTISPADRAALAALAATSEQARLAFEAFQPSRRELSTGEAERIAGKLAAASPIAPPVQALPAKVVPLAGRRPRRAFYLAAALAAAAAGVGYIVSRPPPGPAPEAVALYDLTVAGGQADQRSQPAPAGAPLHLGPRSRIELTLQPKTDVQGPIAVTAALVRGREVRRWDAPAEISRSGAVHIVAHRRTSFNGVPSGAWDLIVAVGRPGALPSVEALPSIQAAPETAQRPFRVLRVQLTLDETDEDARPPPAPIALSGCASVWRGPVCKIAGDTRLLFVAGASTEGPTIEVSVDGEPEAVNPERLPGRWWRIPVGVKAAAREITVLVREGETRRELRLPIAPEETDPSLEEAESLRWKGRLDEARAAVTPLLTDARPPLRALARGKLARVERMRGQYEPAAALFREAIELDHESGLVSGEVNDRIALAHTLSVELHRFEEARSVLDGTGPLEAEYPEARILATYERALQPYETGDLRSALGLFTESAELAERFGREDLRVNALQPEAEVLWKLGHAAEALALFRALQEGGERGTDRCNEAFILDNFGWFALRAGESVEGASSGVPDPVPLLEKALSRYREACAEPANLSNALTNLAIAAIDRRRAAEARRRLAEARAVEPHPGARRRVFWDLVEARIALVEGHAAEALPSFERMAALARSDQNRDALLEAAVGRAEALDALGRSALAREAFAEADALLEEHGSLVPVWEGKEAFFAWHEQSTRRRIDFLLRYAEARSKGSPEGALALKEAAAAARRSRGRVLIASQSADRLASLPAGERARWQEAMDHYQSRRAELDEKAEHDWELSKEAQDRAWEERAAAQEQLRSELDRQLAALGPSASRPGVALSEPAEGELYLVYFPVNEGWAGFAITVHDVVARRLGAIDLSASSPAELSEKLLRPFQREIQAASRLRFSPYGPLERADFHALPWEGAPLLRRAPVEYGIDVPWSRPASEPPAVPRRALLVADPSSDLEASRREADVVEPALRERGFTVERLQGDAATHEALRAALGKSDLGLFHYSGHGAFGGAGGLESALPLARQGRLTLGDILALSRAPDRVVLSSCEAGRTSVTSGPPGLGLGQAFLAIGSIAVVAATRKVDDALAAELAERLYDGAPATAPLDLAAALRKAQLAAPPSSDWAALRVLVP